MWLLGKREMLFVGKKMCAPKGKKCFAIVEMR
jgi:hypothetical protein